MNYKGLTRGLTIPNSGACQYRPSYWLCCHITKIVSVEDLRHDAQIWYQFDYEAYDSFSMELLYKICFDDKNKSLDERLMGCLVQIVYSYWKWILRPNNENISWSCENSSFWADASFTDWPTSPLLHVYVSKVAGICCTGPAPATCKQLNVQMQSIGFMTFIED